MGANEKQMSESNLDSRPSLTSFERQSKDFCSNLHLKIIIDSLVVVQLAATNS